MENILEGIRILDFTRILSGPYATRILGDFGAEIIKVQFPGSHEIETATGYFDTWNRNKRSIALDMTFPESRRLALKLVEVSDVIIENFSPRVMGNWGMEYETLKRTKPDIIMLSMSGMGQTGPWKDYVAFGPTVQSLGGLTYLTGFEKDSPIGSGYALADHNAGLYAAFVILAALENRDRTGQGQYIDLSQYEVVATMIGPALLNVIANKHKSLPQGNQPDYEMAAPHGCYQCRGDDRWCVIAVLNETEWQTLVKMMGMPDWAFKKEFSTLEKRKIHFKSLDKILNQWTRKQDANELVELLQEAGVRAGIVQNAQDLSNDPHLRDRDFFVHLEHPLLGCTVSDRSPIRFVQNQAAEIKSENNWRSSPMLGEGNRYVYMDLLGLNEQEYLSYLEKGIVG